MKTKVSCIFKSLSGRSSQVRRAEHVAHMGGMRNAYSILVGKPEGKTYSKDLGVDGRSIRMDLREIGWT